MPLDNFYDVKECHRCGKKFSNKILRIQSWFNEQVICSLECNDLEKNILQFLGDKKYKYEDCGIIPSVKQLQEKDAK